jgi:ribonucleoside-diphosphate reductase subunit M1
MSAPAFKADVEDGDSPRLLTADNHTAPTKESVPEADLDSGSSSSDSDAGTKQAEDADPEREGDIYADAVLQCSIENKEACVMCSG